MNGHFHLRKSKLVFLNNSIDHCPPGLPGRVFSLFRKTGSYAIFSRAARGSTRQNKGDETRGIVGRAGRHPVGPSQEESPHA